MLFLLRGRKYGQICRHWGPALSVHPEMRAMISDDSRWLLTIPDDIWRFSVISDNFRWISKILITHHRMHGQCQASMSTDPTTFPRLLCVWTLKKSGFQIIPNQGFLLIVHHWYLLLFGGGGTIFNSQIPSSWHVLSDISASPGPILKYLDVLLSTRMQNDRGIGISLSQFVKKIQSFKVSKTNGSESEKQKKEFPPIPVSFHQCLLRYLSVCQYISLSYYLIFCLSVCICLSVYLSVCFTSF